MRELALFTGAGGGILGGLLLGWRTTCAVEIDPYCRSVLLARQRDESLDPFPIWDDVCTFDGRPWRGHIDVISGGFPCQDISSAGSASARSGLHGEKSGLWREYARILDEVEPAWAIIENSPHLRHRGLVSILQDLADLGYDAAWDVFDASAIGAPQARQRLWIVAHRHDTRQRAIDLDDEVASAPTPRGDDEEAGTSWWPVDCVSGMDDGLAHRMDRVRATGNGQVPGVVALAWTTLTRRLFQAELKIDRRGM